MWCSGVQCGGVQCGGVKCGGVKCGGVQWRHVCAMWWRGVESVVCCSWLEKSSVVL